MALLMVVLCWIVAVCGIIDNVYEKKRCLLFLLLAFLLTIAYTKDICLYVKL